ncbi:MAG: hypothetical protein CMM52_07700 [Rhodospirillaceae bacterium]|nr:hypothetical protein [Rhodospirillaceae bacterium]|tara:strand:+ start:23970 stop:24461 length:492 start_codon:yes stop_codon:yes gene_type:complete
MVFENKMATRQASTAVVSASRTWQTNTMIKRVTIHGIDHARAACEVAMSINRQDGFTLELWSARHGAGSLGPAWFDNIVRIIRSEYPDLNIVGVLDCGDAAGNALAALRQGVGCIYVSLKPTVTEKIKAIAGQSNGDVRTRRPKMPDLMEYENPGEMLQAHFS